MKKVFALVLAAVMLLASVCISFADEDILIAPASAQPFIAATMEGAALENIEKTEAAYTYTNWNGVPSVVDLYTITVPGGTQNIKLSFDSERLCYNYAFTGEGAPSVTDAEYLSGAVADENTQDGRVSFTVPVDSALVNYDGTTSPADGVIDYVQIQTAYDADWNTTVLYAITFKMEGEAETTVSAFTDVSADAAYAAAVNWAYEQGITAGIGSGRFGTGQTVTRGQLLTFVWNLAGKPETSIDAERLYGDDLFTIFYNDTYTRKYYTTAIDWAYSSGLADGVEPHTFGADLEAEHKEIINVLAGYLGKTAEEIGAFVPAGTKREDVITAIYNLCR